MCCVLLAKQREKFFQHNGGFLYSKSFPVMLEPPKQPKKFSAEDHQRATSNYDEGKVISQEAYGAVYNGILLVGCCLETEVPLLV